MIDAIIEIYGHKEGLTITSDGVIVDWPYEALKPTGDALSNLADRQRQINLISQIKRKAGDVIISRIPDWKQRNLIAEASLILSDASLSQADKDAALVDYKACLSWTKEVRLHSDHLESEVLAGNAVDINAGWPDWPPAGLTGNIVT